MEQINLSTNGKEIQKAYEKVVKDDPDFSWVIYGPDSTKAYTVSETGTDFDEFLESFDESQIQFGLARITPPGSDVKKNLLIGWCPDSAPLKPRSSFAQNFAEVSKLLKGYHVQITARDSDDLDRDELLSRLSSAAGARYSIQASRTNTPSSTASAFKPTPVSRPTPSSVPKASPKPSSFSPKAEEPQVIKPKPFVQASKKSNDDDDWNEPEIEERDFSKKPLTPNVSAYKPIGRVNLQDVIKEENAKVDARAEIADLKKKDRLKKDQEIDDFLKAKPASFSSKAPSPISSFGSSSDKLVGGISKGFGSENGKTPAQIWAEKKQREQGKSASASPQPVSHSEDVDEEEEESVSELKSKYEQINANAEKEEEEANSSHNDSHHDENVSDLKSRFEKFNTADKDSAPSPAPRKSFPPPPVRQVVQEEEPEQESEEEEEESPAEEEEEAKPSLPSRAAVPPPPARPTEPEAQEEEEEEEEEAPVQEEQELTYTAIAEYDYEASEGNELGFREGEVITIIDFIDEDWWLGESESGEKGLFPSNYVTLEEQ